MPIEQLLPQPATPNVWYSYLCLPSRIADFFRHAFQRKAAPASIEQLFLIHRPTGAIIQHALRIDNAHHKSSTLTEQRAIASMVTYLLSYFRDQKYLTHYLRVGHLRIEQFTYGIHGGPECTLLSVIRTPRGADAGGTLAECQGILEHIHCEHADILRKLAEHPEVQLPEMLPELRGL